MPFVDLHASLTKTVIDLPPGETRRLEIEVSEGAVEGITLEGRACVLFPITGPPAAEPQRFDIVFGEKVRKPTAREIAPGTLVLDIHNVTAELGTFALSILPPDMGLDHAPMQIVPFLKGKRLLTTQTFRHLFRSEMIHASEGIGIRNITILFTDLKGLTALYHEIDAFNHRRLGRALLLKIGIHRGALIAVTLNDRLDYFGQTVNVAARVRALADANEIYLTREVYEGPGVAALLRNSRSPVQRTNGSARRTLS